MAELAFTATVAADNRGKLPTGLTHSLGCAPGDVIEFTVTGKGRNSAITGSRVLRGQNADKARKTARSQSKSPAAPKPEASNTVKVVAKPKAVPVPAKQVKKVAKPVPVPAKTVKKVAKVNYKESAKAPKKVVKRK